MTNNPMPPYTLEFLKAYLKWADAGAPERKPFLNAVGLCGNYGVYISKRYLIASVFDADFYSWLPKYIGIVRRVGDFNDIEYDCYPFGVQNGPGNIKRMTWVRETIAKLEETS